MKPTLHRILLTGFCLLLFTCVVKSDRACAEDIPLDLIRDGNDYAVLLQNFMALLGELYPESDVRWDIGRSQLIIKAQDKEIEIYSHIPRIKLDREYRQLQRPLYMRGERVMVPIQTVQLTLKHLGVEFQVEGIDVPEAPIVTEPPDPQTPDTTIPELRFPEDFSARTSGTPLPQATPAPVGSGSNPTSIIPPNVELPEPIPQPTGATVISATEQTAIAQPSTDSAVTTPMGAPGLTPAIPDVSGQETPAVIVEGEIGMSVEEMLNPQGQPTPEYTPLPRNTPKPRPVVPGVSVPEMSNVPMPEAPIQSTGANMAIQPPPALIGKIGLSWGQLADLLHRQPPRRVVLVCDRVLEQAAEQAADKLRAGLGMDARVIVSPLRRRDKNSLYEEILSNSPQLLVDLMTLPIDSEQTSPQETPYLVWAVHESLWPQDRQQGDPLRISQRYKPHQFQSLALGSLMRTELSLQFPDRQILYELSPGYLLRRIDAPSVAVIIPVKNDNTLAADQSARAAEAVYGAIAGYHRGMDSVKF